MEENIEILEDLANILDKTCESGKCESSTSIRNLIKDYKKLKEDFEIVAHECSRLEKEDIRKDLEINALQKEHEHDVKMIDEVKGEAVKLYKEIDKLKRQIEIKDKYLELMWFLGADYDGWDTADGLKSLIDNLMNLVKKAGNNDDKYAAYEGGNGKYFNILYEEVEKENDNGEDNRKQN